MDAPNKLRHLFGKPQHGLDALVRRYGSEEAAAQAIFDAVRSVYESGGLRMEAAGYYGQAFDVAGIQVTVRGRIVRGIVRVGTAFVTPQRA